MKIKNSLLLPFLYVQIAGVAQTNFDLQGHRGARGLYPENTIVAFIEAVKLGVTTLEMDVVVSKDGQLVVSHEPWMNESICALNGEKLKGNAKEQHNIYQLTYEQIKKYDCGSNGNDRFPDQKKIAASKPLLAEVIDTIEKYVAANKLKPLFYNIETKSTVDGDEVFHPKPAVFSELVYDMLKKKHVLQRSIVQAFDVRTLQAMKQIDSTVTLALLVFNADGLNKNIERLGFTPHIYSPNFALVNKALVRKCHQKNMLIIPWTVNDEQKMKQLKRLGVDGLITDYPNIATALFFAKKQ